MGQKSRNTHRQQEIECDFCGCNPKRAHVKGKCPAKGKKCLVCRKKHHFAHGKVCPSKSVEKVQQESDER